MNQVEERLPLTELLRMPTVAQAEAYAMRWATTVQTYEDATEMLTPLYVAELLPEGQVITDRVPAAWIADFRIRLVERLVVYWKRRKRAQLALDGWDAGVRAIMEQSRKAGMPFDLDQARALLRIHIVQRMEMSE